MFTVFTTNPQKTVFHAAALEKVIKFPLYVARQHPPLRIQVEFKPNYQNALAAAEAFDWMMGPPSIALFQAFLSYQKARKVTGDMIEFGVYRGRSASVLLGNLRPKEEALLIDIADYPELDKLSRISASPNSTSFSRANPRI